jgi:hypothetical protein
MRGGWLATVAFSREARGQRPQLELGLEGPATGQKIDAPPRAFAKSQTKGGREKAAGESDVHLPQPQPQKKCKMCSYLLLFF